MQRMIAPRLYSP